MKDLRLYLKWKWGRDGWNYGNTPLLTRDRFAGYTWQPVEQIHC